MSTRSTRNKTKTLTLPKRRKQINDNDDDDDDEDYKAERSEEEEEEEEEEIRFSQRNSRVKKVIEDDDDDDDDDNSNKNKRGQGKHNNNEDENEEDEDEEEDEEETQRKQKTKKKMLAKQLLLMNSKKSKNKAAATRLVPMYNSYNRQLERESSYNSLLDSEDEADDLNDFVVDDTELGDEEESDSDSDSDSDSYRAKKRRAKRKSSSDKVKRDTAEEMDRESEQEDQSQTSPSYQQKRKRVILDDDDDENDNNNDNDNDNHNGSVDEDEDDSDGIPSSNSNSQRSSQTRASYEEHYSSSSTRARQQQRSKNSKREYLLARVRARKQGAIDLIAPEKDDGTKEVIIYNDDDDDENDENDEDDIEDEDNDDLLSSSGDVSYKHSKRKLALKKGADIEEDEEDDFINDNEDEINNVNEEVLCLCGANIDEGYQGQWLKCHNSYCMKWQHTACFGYILKKDIPKHHRCQICSPSSYAVKRYQYFSSLKSANTLSQQSNSSTMSSSSQNVTEGTQGSQPHINKKRRVIIDDDDDDDDDDNMTTPDESSQKNKQQQQKQQLPISLQDQLGFEFYTEALNGNIEKMSTLISQHKNTNDLKYILNWKNPMENNQTCVHAIISNFGKESLAKALEMLQLLVSTRCCLLNTLDLKNNSPFLLAIQLNAFEIVTYLLQYASDRRNKVESELEHDAIDSIKIEASDDMLHCAASLDQSRILDLLLKTHNNDGNSNNNYEYTSLLWSLLGTATREKSLACVKYLLDTPEICLGCGKLFDTFYPTLQSIAEAQKKIMEKILLKAQLTYGAESQEQRKRISDNLPSLSENTGQKFMSLAASVIHQATTLSSTGPIELDFYSKAYNNHNNNNNNNNNNNKNKEFFSSIFDYFYENGDTLVHLAVESGNEEIVTVILNALPTEFKSIANNDGVTPLALASECGFIACTSVLIDRLQGSFSTISSSSSSSSSFPSSVSWKGAKVLTHPLVSCDEHGTTALHLAALSGHTECVQLLLEAGHPVYILDDSGWTPLLYSVFHSHMSTILPLMQAMPEQLTLLSSLLNSVDASGSSAKNKQVISKCITLLATVPEYYDMINSLIANQASLLENAFEFILRSYPGCINFENKLIWLRANIQRIIYQQKQRSILVNRNALLDSLVNEYSLETTQLLSIRSSSSFSSFASSTIDNPLLKFEGSLCCSLNLRFQHEAGVYLGPLREYYQLLPKDFINPDYNLFRVVISSSGTDDKNESETKQQQQQQQQQQHHRTCVFPVSSIYLDMDENYAEIRSRRMFAAGLAVGLAIANDVRIPVYFSSAFLKLLLRKPVGFEDLESFEVDIYKNLKWIQENDIGHEDSLALSFSVDATIKRVETLDSSSKRAKQQQQKQQKETKEYDNDDDDECVLLNEHDSIEAFMSNLPMEGMDTAVRVSSSSSSSLSFSSTASSSSSSKSSQPLPDQSTSALSPSSTYQRTFQLKNRGSEIPVTEENKPEFIEARSRFALDSVRTEADLFCSALSHVVPFNLWKFFTPAELSLLIAGTPEISVSDWKANTRYSELGPEVIAWFWEILSEMSSTDLSLLLQFSTGSSQLPPGGFANLQPPFHLCGAVHANPESLPTASTCFNLLKIPLYSSEKQFKKKLLIAVRHGYETFSFA